MATAGAGTEADAGATFGASGATGAAAATSSVTGAGGEFVCTDGASALGIKTGSLALSGELASDTVGSDGGGALATGVGAAGGALATGAPWAALARGGAALAVGGDALARGGELGPIETTRDGITDGRDGSDDGGPALSSGRAADGADDAGEADGRGACGATDGTGFTAADPSGGVDLPRGIGADASEGGWTEAFVAATGALTGTGRGSSELTRRSDPTLAGRDNSTLAATRSCGTGGCGGTVRLGRESERAIQLGARVDSDGGGCRSPTSPKPG